MGNGEVKKVRARTGSLYIKSMGNYFEKMVGSDD
jgi:hypothetical protein